jgi:hypothetical protein
MNKKDVLVPLGNHKIHCATYTYSHAIVAQVDPFILCSDTGDMIWYNEKPKDFKKVGVADDISWEAVVDRFEWEDLEDEN